MHPNNPNAPGVPIIPPSKHPINRMVRKKQRRMLIIGFLFCVDKISDTNKIAIRITIGIVNALI